MIDVQQIIYALERQERALSLDAQNLTREHDYSAEFPAEDANRMREAIALIQGAGAALTELIALKDLHDEETQLRQHRFTGISRDPEGLARVAAMRDEYNRRKPLAWNAARAALVAGPAPIDMVLHCPKCRMQHVDAPEISGFTTLSGPLPGGWSNPPHRSHLCHGCGNIWRPADVPTNGVAAVKTKGKTDSPIVEPVRR